MKTVIEMVRESADPDKVDPFMNGFWVLTQEELERFSELVRKDYSFTHAQMWLKRFDDAILTEREECAKVCEPQEEHDDPLTAWKIAGAIRARGEASIRNNT